MIKPLQEPIGSLNVLGVVPLNWNCQGLKEIGIEGWLLRREYFFEVGKITFENRVKVATIHLDWRALQWHQNFFMLHGNEAFADWNSYVRYLTARFGRNTYDDPLADLRNLRQDRSLQEYLDGFDQIHPKTGINEGQALFSPSFYMA